MYMLGTYRGQESASDTQGTGVTNCCERPCCGSWLVQQKRVWTHSSQSSRKVHSQGSCGIQIGRGVYAYLGGLPQEVRFALQHGGSFGPYRPGVVAYTFSPSTQEAEASTSL